MSISWSRKAAPLLLRTFRRHHHCASRLAVVSSQIHAAQLTNFSSGWIPSQNVFGSSSKWFGGRHMSSDISVVPKLSDPTANEALNVLLATSWSNIKKDIKDDVEAAIQKGGDGVLSTVWTSAQAVEKFADTLLYLRMEVDELCGVSGEAVKKLPDGLLRALDAAYNKYETYLASFNDDETFLRKKVENELGGILLAIKQRCSGLGPQWGKIALLGTSGLSGSYIEGRSAKQ